MEIQVEILLPPAQLCICCPCSRPGHICWVLWKQRVCHPWKWQTVQVNLFRKLSGPASNNRKKRPLPQNLFFLRTTGSLYWHFFGYLLPLSSSDSFQEASFLHSLLQFGSVTWAEQEDFLLLFGTSGLLRNHRDAPWGGRLSFSPHSKVWFLGSVEGLILVCGFSGWSVFLLYTWCAQDVWLTMQSQAHTVTPQIYWAHEVHTALKLAKEFLSRKSIYHSGPWSDLPKSQCLKLN